MLVAGAGAVSAGGRVKGDGARKASVLAAIVRYIEAHRVPPTIEELASELRVSVAVVHRQIVRLESDGAIESLWVAGRRSPRSLRVVASRQVALEIE